MAKVSTYLNFRRETEQAFIFYKDVFNTQIDHGIMRYGDIPAAPGEPEVSEADKNLIMHTEIEILGGHILMGTDMPESMGFDLKFGNNNYIMLQTDTKAETDELFNALSDGGTIEQPLSEMFWGAYYGSLCDKFGVQWMFHCEEK